ncbi:MAG: hypothetical protein ABIH39_06680, partial [Candidatus Margulisiibacteriota bacterium]
EKLKKEIPDMKVFDKNEAPLALRQVVIETLFNIGSILAEGGDWESSLEQYEQFEDFIEKEMKFLKERNVGESPYLDYLDLTSQRYTRVIVDMLTKVEAFQLAEEKLNEKIDEDDCNDYRYINKLGWLMQKADLYINWVNKGALSTNEIKTKLSKAIKALWEVMFDCKECEKNNLVLSRRRRRALENACLNAKAMEASLMELGRRMQFNIGINSEGYGIISPDEFSIDPQFAAERIAFLDKIDVDSTDRLYTEFKSQLKNSEYISSLDKKAIGAKLNLAYAELYQTLGVPIKALGILADSLNQQEEQSPILRVRAAKVVVNSLFIKGDAESVRAALGMLCKLLDPQKLSLVWQGGPDNKGGLAKWLLDREWQDVYKEFEPFFTGEGNSTGNKWLNALKIKDCKRLVMSPVHQKDFVRAFGFGIDKLSMGKLSEYNQHIFPAYDQCEKEFMAMQREIAKKLKYSGPLDLIGIENLGAEHLSGELMKIMIGDTLLTTEEQQKKLQEIWKHLMSSAVTRPEYVLLFCVNFARALDRLGDVKLAVAILDLLLGIENDYPHKKIDELKAKLKTVHIPLSKEKSDEYKMLKERILTQHGIGRRETRLKIHEEKIQDLPKNINKTAGIDLKIADMFLKAEKTLTGVSSQNEIENLIVLYAENMNEVSKYNDPQKREQFFTYLVNLLSARGDYYATKAIQYAVINNDLGEFKEESIEFWQMTGGKVTIGEKEYTRENLETIINNSRVYENPKFVYEILNSN